MTCNMGNLIAAPLGLHFSSLSAFPASFSLSRLCRCKGAHEPAVGLRARAAGQYPEQLCLEYARLVVAAWEL
eukprot:240012-Amphidinium_carterae.1